MLRLAVLGRCNETARVHGSRRRGGINGLPCCASSRRSEAKHYDSIVKECGQCRTTGRKRFDMERATDRVGPPSRLLLALEVRGIWELQAFFAAYPLLRRAPRGDGHPVLRLPGVSASDVSTPPRRTYLRAQGYAGPARNQGPNHG